MNNLVLSQIIESCHRYIENTHNNIECHRLVTPLYTSTHFNSVSFTYTKVTHRRSYRSSGREEGPYTLQASFGSPPWEPDLSWCGRRDERAKPEHLCMCCFSGCDCKEMKVTSGFFIFYVLNLKNVMPENSTVTEKASDLAVKEPAVERQSMMPPTMQRTDPDQPMNRAAPSSYLRERTVVVLSLVSVRHTKCYGCCSYFCATNVGSKNSVVIRCAYREQALSEQRPEEWTNRRTQTLALPHLTISLGLPLRMKVTPAKQAILALLPSLPPILVHFIPTRANTEPKKPRQMAAIIRPLHAWM